MHDMQTEAGAPLSSTPTSDAAAERRPASRRALLLTLAAAAVVIYALDQLTKAWAVTSLTPGEPRNLLGSLLRLNLIENPGAAFSIATGATWVLTIIAVGVVAVIVYSIRRLGSRGWAWALGLLLGGALGNLTDRLVRAPGPGRGHVVDFLELPHWPIFNVADSAIVSAAVLIVLLALRGTGLDGRRATRAGGRHEADGGTGA